VMAITPVTPPERGDGNNLLILRPVLNPGMPKYATGESFLSSASDPLEPRRRVGLTDAAHRAHPQVPFDPTPALLQSVTTTYQP
jgi:hypothetical protein